ncbi:MAG: hypothetical protein JWR83_2732 [Aeromicrobium sp.]|nr:hypothetical protein [Aeromicrobium sp.]
MPAERFVVTAVYDMYLATPRGANRATMAVGDTSPFSAGAGFRTVFSIGAIASLEDGDTT